MGELDSDRVLGGPIHFGETRATATMEHSIKGNTLTFIVEEAQQLAKTSPALRAGFATLPLDLQALIETGVSRTLWYPVAMYDALAELLCEHSGQDRLAYLRELGHRDFERLQQVTTYRQVAYAQGLQRERTVDTKLRDSRLITSMMATVFNFSCWEPAPDPLSPKHIVIRVTDAEHVPEAFRILTEGFQTAMNRSINPQARAVRSERARPDLIYYRTNGPKP